MTHEPLRMFNDSGLNTFQGFIYETRASEKSGGPRLNSPRHLLFDDAMTVPTEVHAEIDTTNCFETRFDIATYLNNVLSAGFDERLYDQSGLWAWLALFYFDRLRSDHGITQRSEHFIPDEWAKQTPGQDLGYRHSVRTPFRLLRDYGEDFAKFFLLGRPTSQMGDIVEQVVSRPKLLRTVRIRLTMLALYQAQGGGVKRGAASVPAKSRTSEAGRGGIRRFAHVYVPRVKLGYDIDRMEVGEIITACGAEISDSRFANS